MEKTRKPAVAGTFYPADPIELHSTVEGFLQAAEAEGAAPKAMIAPHAGYIYSGPVAASGYAHLRQVRHLVHRVILLGPSHHVPLNGLAVPTAESFSTPLGRIPLDTGAIKDILSLPQVHANDEAHLMEHSLEVHLPFLQVALGEFTLLPIVVGHTTEEEVCEVLEHLWGGPETLVIISSDLSHYHDYETARRMDMATSRNIEALDFEDIGYESACGRAPLGGLLLYARRHGLQATTIDLRNSGDTAGPRDQVVGYGTYVFN